MTQMSMGANLSLSTPAVRAVVQWTSGAGVPDVDVSALLLDDSGQPSTALLTAMLRRTPEGGWDLTAIGEFYNFRTVKRLVPAAARHVTR